MNRLFFSVIIATLAGVVGCRGHVEQLYDAAYVMVSDQEALHRAYKCQEVSANLAAIKAAGPFEVASSGAPSAQPTKGAPPAPADKTDPAATTCKVVAKGLKPGEPWNVHGVVLPELTGKSECASLVEAWPKAWDKFVQSLTFEKQIACNADGKTTPMLDSASELQARMRAYDVASMMITGRQDFDMRACYPHMKKHLIGDQVTFAKLRCDVLTKDAAIAGITSAKLLELAAISYEQVDPDGAQIAAFTLSLRDDKDLAKNREAFDQKIDAEKLRLIAATKAKYCSPPKETSLEDQADIARAAMTLCLGHARTEAAIGASSHDTESFNEDLNKAIKASVDAKQDVIKACTDGCNADYANCMRIHADDLESLGCPTAAQKCIKACQ